MYHSLAGISSFMRRTALASLQFLILHIFRNIFQLTAQNAAKLAERVGADIAVFPKAVQLAAADMVFLHQFILGNPSVFHRGPKLIKYDHGHASFIVSAYFHARISTRARIRAIL